MIKKVLNDSYLPYGEITALSEIVQQIGLFLNPQAKPAPDLGIPQVYGQNSNFTLPPHGMQLSHSFFSNNMTHSIMNNSSSLNLAGTTFSL
jgi:hypothetical protein